MNIESHWKDVKIGWEAETMVSLGFVKNEEEWQDFRQLLNDTAQCWILDKLGVVVE